MSTDVSENSSATTLTIKSKLRIVYLAGPGDVIGTYRAWASGEDDRSQVSLTYSGQFFDVWRKLGAEALVISQHSRADRIVAQSLRVEHWPNRFKKSRGPIYLLGMWYQSLRFVMAAIRYRADVVIATEGMGAWPPLRLLKWFGIQLVPNLMCVLWLTQHPPRGRIRRWMLRLDGPTFSRQASAIISMSAEISRQVTELSQGKPRPIIEFVPIYRREMFADIGIPPSNRSPFRVLFAGRIEEVKGVFDLLEVARRISATGGTPVEFDLCGTGAALDSLKRAVADEGLAESFRCHGHCDRSRMREMFSRSHIVIVPTTSRFVEGFNQVVAESVIAGRPVVTSSVCPAVERVRAAVLEVPPDDVAAYTAAVIALRDDLSLFEGKRAACATVSEQFFDLEQSWGSAVIKAVGVHALAD